MIHCIMCCLIWVDRALFTFVTFINGHLKLFQADVIVDSTASSLQLKHGGLSESLLEMAGPEMQDECDNSYPNGIKLGEEMAVTGGYGLKCKKVYHGTLPKWSDKSKNAIMVIFYILKEKETQQVEI